MKKTMATLDVGQFKLKIYREIKGKKTYKTMVKIYYKNRSSEISVKRLISFLLIPIKEDIKELIS